MDERQMLKNLFEKRGQVTWYGSVVDRLSVGRYSVEDSAGRIVATDCDQSQFYPKGARVIVQNGRIIGGGQLSGDHKTYEV